MTRKSSAPALWVLGGLALVGGGFAVGLAVASNTPSSLPPPSPPPPRRKSDIIAQGPLAPQSDPSWPLNPPPSTPQVPDSLLKAWAQSQGVTKWPVKDRSDLEAAYLSGRALTFGDIHIFNDDPLF